MSDPTAVPRSYVVNPAYDWDYIRSLQDLAFRYAKQEEEPTHTLARHILWLTSTLLKQQLIVPALTPQRHNPLPEEEGIQIRTVAYRPKTAEESARFEAYLEMEALALPPHRNFLFSLRQGVEKVILDYPPDSDTHILAQATLDLIDTLWLGHP